MSVQMMGAVISCGPQDRTQFCVLLALANYADEFGFAYPSLITLAADSRCDERTTRRQVIELEASGWLYVARKVLNGKSNVYFLNLSRMGVTAPGDRRRNPLFIRLVKSHPDTMTPIFAPERQIPQPAPDPDPVPFFSPEESPDTGTFSEDNPQGVQRTFEPTHRTKEGGSPDKLCPPNRKNRHSYNRQGTTNEVEPPPPTPAGGEERDEQTLDRNWARLLTALKLDLANAPAKHSNFAPIQPGWTDWEACFAWCGLLGWRATGNPPRVTLVLELGDGAPGPECTLAGLTKYRGRLEALAREYFPIPSTTEIRFELLGIDPAKGASHAE